MRVRATLGSPGAGRGEAPPQPHVQVQPHHDFQQSTLHSPVPYLFGGLAAMLGLIAFALLILACSYWKLSGYLDDASDDNAPDATADAHNHKAPASAFASAWENKVLVVMAGQVMPTFLATPSTSRSTSFGIRDTDNTSTSTRPSSSSSSDGAQTGDTAADLKTDHKAAVELSEVVAGAGGSGSGEVVDHHLPVGAVNGNNNQHQHPAGVAT